jgi:membrane protein
MLENVIGRVSTNVEHSLGWQPFGFGILLGVVVPLALTFLVFLLLYRYIPHHRPGWPAALLGSAAAAIGFQAVQVGLGWYLSGPADFSKVYGSASAIFAFLFSVYLGASAFVICAILTKVLDERLPPRG